MANALLMRHFFKQLAKKMASSSDLPAEVRPQTQPSRALPRLPWQGKTDPLMDARERNHVMDVDENEVDFDENTPMSIMPNVKVDVEGGDSHVPPGFETQTQ